MSSLGGDILGILHQGIKGTQLFRAINAEVTVAEINLLICPGDEIVNNLSEPLLIEGNFCGG